MPWFWGSSKKDEDSEDEEYDSEEYTDEEYESGDESYTSEEQEIEEEDVVVVKNEEKVNDKKEEAADASSTDAIAVTEESAAPEKANRKSDNDGTAAATENKKPPNGSALKNSKDSGNGMTTTEAYAHEFHDEDDDDDDSEGNEDNAIHTERIEAGVPDQVMGNRHRAPSALTLGDDEEESNGSIGDTDESVHSEASQEQEDHVTTLAEKQSLLVLAAEHDRVDILNSVLSEADEKDELLHGGIPPLHIAVLNGSVNTATCLLRMGADPSVRPDVKEIAQNQDPSAPLDVPKQINGVTAWELAFDEKIVPKSKQQGLMNAFSAEALRCMGSDEGPRLQQLLRAGMPSDMPVMGDKSLYDWAVELGSPSCEEVLRPAQAAKHEDADTIGAPDAAHVSSGKSAVLDRPGSEETVEQMTRQLEELESLAKALSTCLDNLAEEVSVSHGLLLMGGGASALAAHVRSLKTLKENKMQELSRHQEAFENTQDELEYWVNQAGSMGQKIANQEAPVGVPAGSRRHSMPPKFSSCAEESSFCENLHQKITATHEKIRKFRVSIADLSEENDRNMQEVEKRGLTGGINLVRGLKEEIREIDFSLEETKLAEAVYRAKLDRIQALLNSKDDSNGEIHDKTGEEASVADTSNASTERHFNHVNGNGAREASPQESDSSDVVSDQAGDMKPSEKVASGHSTALTVRREGPGPGSFPLALWQILLRIIGLRDEPAPPPPQRRQSSGTFTSSAQPAMIV